MTIENQLYFRGMLLTMEERQYAIQTELEALSTSLHQKIPIIDGILHHKKDLDTKAAHVILIRIMELEKEARELDTRMATVKEKI